MGWFLCNKCILPEALQGKSSQEIKQAFLFSYNFCKCWYRTSVIFALKNCTFLLYFPSLFERHWFVFAVDIKARKFIFLDSSYSKESSYQKAASHKLVISFFLVLRPLLQHDTRRRLGKKGRWGRRVQV